MGLLSHFLDLYLAMSRQRSPAIQYDEHNCTNSLCSKPIHPFRHPLQLLSVAALHPDCVEEPHDRAMRGHPTRLCTRQERVEARDERCGPEVHCRPPAREELRRGPEGVSERREHTQSIDEEETCIR